jgi:O-acetyl-ADP-ribose deacetylase (regulator of RNase III)
MANLSERIQVLRGDITRLETDAIVNAANSSLLGGGGVDGAIHRAAGPALDTECRAVRDRQGGCPAGDAVMTGAGAMPCRKVIHTVGPVWRGGDAGEARTLASCYARCIELAREAGLESIAFPNIGTGIYGYPKEEAAAIAYRTVEDALETAPSIRRVVFVCYDAENFDLYQQERRRRSR